MLTDMAQDHRATTDPGDAVSDWAPIRAATSRS